MDTALALATDYLQMPHAWIAVILPGALAMAALVAFRRVWLSSWTVMAVLLGTALTWLSARWSITPDHVGLHLQPAAFVILLVLWRRQLVAAADLATAFRWAASLAGLTWLSLLVVDVGACLNRPECLLTGTGGAGLLDTLVLLPSIAFAGALLIWRMTRTGRHNQPQEA